MKASELMLGDWVSHRGENIKVFSLEADADIEWGVVGDIETNDIEPIPLTAEILEKNFNRMELPDDPYGTYFFGGNDYTECCIKEYTDGLWEISIEEIEMGGFPTWKMYVSSVHQLQHALRLCGIDK